MSWRAAQAKFGKDAFPSLARYAEMRPPPHIEAMLAPVPEGDETARLRALLAEAVPVLAYVSRGRRYVGVEPYPDAAARRVLGAIHDHDPNLIPGDTDG